MKIRACEDCKYYKKDGLFNFVFNHYCKHPSIKENNINISFLTGNKMEKFNYMEINRMRYKGNPCEDAKLFEQKITLLNYIKSFFN